MVISILTRKIRLTDRGQWESQLARILPRLRQVLESEQGFDSMQYLWSVYSDGETAQITTWRTLEDCQRYVREGGAASVATIEEAAIPTALHPHGSWVRRTFEIVEPDGNAAPG